MCTKRLLLQCWKIMKSWNIQCASYLTVISLRVAVDLFVKVDFLVCMKSCHLIWIEFWWEKDFFVNHLRKFFSNWNITSLQMDYNLLCLEFTWKEKISGAISMDICKNMGLESLIIGICKSKVILTRRLIVNAALLNLDLFCLIFFHTHTFFVIFIWLLWSFEFSLNCTKLTTLPIKV